MIKNLRLPARSSILGLLARGGATTLLAITTQVSMAQQNTAGNVSVPMNTSPGDTEQGMIEQSGTVIVAIYRGPGYFDESKVGMLGSETRNTGMQGDPKINDSNSELNPDYTPPPPATPLDQNPVLPDPPQIDMESANKNGATASDELEIEEISMPSLPSSQEAPLPPPPSLESLSPPVESSAPSESLPSATSSPDSPLPSSPPAPPVPPVQQEEARPTTSSSQPDELPSLSLPPPPSLDSIPPFEAD